LISSGSTTSAEHRMANRTDGAPARRGRQRSMIASRTTLAIGLGSLAALALGITAGLALVAWLH
jgi:hypothetical protein